jgi:hypothetical protein
MFVYRPVEQKAYVEEQFELLRGSIEYSSQEAWEQLMFDR